MTHHFLDRFEVDVDEFLPRRNRGEDQLYGQGKQLLDLVHGLFLSTKPGFHQFVPEFQDKDFN